ncbi:unnamed protein product [Enterobius vermicularis]|uniref:Gamma-soluble NSF attachment protein n=1 Tax=Enterobius vermicularis TaxID=51028 RepID=A0A0N4VN43_ENTVE|nr:unnamed protein product [Enterobius vermicularis]
MTLDASNQKRIKEALECVKRAEEHLKTSIIKLKLEPNYDGAAVEYERAAVCYRNASDFRSSSQCYLKAAEMHFSHGNVFHSAKNLENAVSLFKELGDNESAAKYMEIAVERYTEAGTLDTAAMALDKAAKLFETSDPEKAINFYKKAIEMVVQSDHARMVDDFLTRLTRLHLSLQHYKEAAETIGTAMDNYMALKTVNYPFRCNEFTQSEYARCCHAVILSYESGDSEVFHQALQAPGLKSLDNEVGICDMICIKLYLRIIKKLMTVKLEGDFDHLAKKTRNGDHADDADEEGEMDDLK